MEKQKLSFINYYIKPSEDIISILKVIIIGRWILIFGLLFFGILLKYINRILAGFSITSMLSLAIFAIFVNLFYTYYIFFKKEKSKKIVELIKYMQVYVDQIIYTFIIYFAGGIESPNFFYYTLSIIIAAVLFSPSEIFVSIVSALVMYFSLIFFEIKGIIPHHPRFETGFEVMPFDLIISDKGLLVSFLVTPIIAIVFMGPFASSIAWFLKKRELALAEERNFLSVLLDKINFGVVVFYKGSIFSINRFAKNLFASSKILQENVRKYFKEFKKSDKLTAKLEISDKELARTFKLNYFNFMMSGEIYTLLIIEDITPEKNVSEMKSKFISIAAHQLRTPLSAIKWVLSLILQGDIGKITQEQKEFLEKAYISNERMIRLVDDLLNVSRIEEGRITYNFEKEKIENALLGLVESYKIRAKERNIEFVYSVDKEEKPFEIFIDLEKMKLVFDNLLDNAFKYTPSGGKIEFKIRYEKDKIILTVKDTGIGIPKSEMPKLFTKFFRAQNVIRFETEGTGLGLYIVKNIIDSHGGKINCRSEEGKGTEFKITLYKSFTPQKKIFKL